MCFFLLMCTDCWALAWGGCALRRGRVGERAVGRSTRTPRAALLPAEPAAPAINECLKDALQAARTAIAKREESQATGGGFGRK